MKLEDYIFTFDIDISDLTYAQQLICSYPEIITFNFLKKISIKQLNNNIHYMLALDLETIEEIKRVDSTVLKTDKEILHTALYYIDIFQVCIDNSELLHTDDIVSDYKLKNNLYDFSENIIQILNNSKKDSNEI
jgi:hypothetical protein